MGNGFLPRSQKQKKHHKGAFLFLLPKQVQQRCSQAIVRVFEMLIEWDRTQTGRKDAGEK